MTAQWFDISNEGWRRMNAGRPPYELVKELAQNILDENFSNASLNFKMQGTDFVLEAEDDVIGGIANSALVTTVFLTGKEESHLKRGRKGRGLKEFLSVCYKAEVETVGKTIRFLEDGARDEISNNRQQGTKIVCHIREEGWDKKAIREIEKFIGKIILYGNENLSVNEKTISKRSSICSFITSLPTHIIENGVQKTVTTNATVYIYEKTEKKGWIFEMGIPVISSDIPFDIDIQQRIPMNDNRNEVSVEYLEELKTALIQPMFSRLSKQDFLSWAADGIKTWRLDYTLQQGIAELILGGSAHNFVARSDKAIFNDKARQKGKEVFDTRGMSNTLQRIMGTVIKNSDVFIKEIEKDCRPVEMIPTKEEKMFIDEHEELVKKALNIDIKFLIVEKDKDTEGTWTEAFHESVSNPHTVSYNRKAVGKARGMGKDFFLNPYSVQAIDLLIHEMGHEKSDCHDDKAYTDAVTNYGARIAVYLMRKATGVTIARKERTGDTVLNSIKVVLVNKGYMSLNDIYIALNADTVGAKAGIRGVLNRNCLTEDSVFERNSEGGMYKTREILA